MGTHHRMTDAPSALHAALARYERPLLRYAASITGDLEAARDVVQDTFVRLSRETADVESRMAAWLFTVCRNRALDACRKNHRMIPTEPHEMDIRAGRETNPSDVLEQKENASRLTEMVDALPPNQREVIRLKFDAELSYREISEITKLSVSNVGFLLHTAVKTLRELWQKQETAYEIR